MQKQKRWFALYLRPKSEKQVYKSLKGLGVEAYLPLQKQLRQWSDRKKMIEAPLFRSYIFVFVGPREYYTPLGVKGVVKYVTFEGKAAPIPNSQIETVKRLLEQDYPIEVADEPIAPGEMVEITMGSMMGIEGELIEHKGVKKAIVRIDHVTHSLLVTLPKSYIVRAIQS